MNDPASRRRIVVGVDGSPHSLEALRWAAAEAARHGVGLDVVHVWMTPYPISPIEVFSDPAPFEQQARAVLERSTAALGREYPDLDLRPVLVQEYAARGLLQVAEGAELLVVGSRGRGGFTGLLLGSVSQHCVHHAPCPVAVVPSPGEVGVKDRVVVGVDGSEQSYKALHWAIAEAAMRQARLDVINAYDDWRVVMHAGLAPGVDRDALEKASRQLLEEMVTPAVGAAEHRPPEVAQIPVASSAARALIGAGAGADLLVVGSKGRGAVRDLLLGSVSQQCVQHASCPVVVVR